MIRTTPPNLLGRLLRRLHRTTGLDRTEVLAHQALTIVKDHLASDEPLDEGIAEALRLRCGCPAEGWPCASVRIGLEPWATDDTREAGAVAIEPKGQQVAA